ncbi:MAG: hypothetical protein HY593_01595 [Candidatus Omnitrophica bacterium]|nr:hypothetical protein [Candidatus Omnitrophota bacterium]
MTALGELETLENGEVARVTCTPGLRTFPISIADPSGRFSYPLVVGLCKDLVKFNPLFSETLGRNGSPDAYYVADINNPLLYAELPLANPPYSVADVPSLRNQVFVGRDEKGSLQFSLPADVRRLYPYLSIRQEKAGQFFIRSLAAAGVVGLLRNDKAETSLAMKRDEVIHLLNLLKGKEFTMTYRQDEVQQDGVHKGLLKDWVENVVTGQWEIFFETGPSIVFSSGTMVKSIQAGSVKFGGQGVELVGSPPVERLPLEGLGFQKAENPWVESKNREGQVVRANPNKGTLWVRDPFILLVDQAENVTLFVDTPKGFKPFVHPFGGLSVGDLAVAGGTLVFKPPLSEDWLGLVDSRGGTLLYDKMNTASGGEGSLGSLEGTGDLHETLASTLKSLGTRIHGRLRNPAFFFVGDVGDPFRKAFVEGKTEVELDGKRKLVTEMNIYFLRGGKRGGEKKEKGVGDFLSVKRERPFYGASLLRVVDAYRKGWFAKQVRLFPAGDSRRAASEIEAFIWREVEDSLVRGARLGFGRSKRMDFKSMFLLAKVLLHQKGIKDTTPFQILGGLVRVTASLGARLDGTVHFYDSQGARLGTAVIPPGVVRRAMAAGAGRVGSRKKFVSLMETAAKEEEGMERRAAGILERFDGRHPRRTVVFQVVKEGKLMAEEVSFITKKIEKLRGVAGSNVGVEFLRKEKDGVVSYEAFGDPVCWKDKGRATVVISKPEAWILQEAHKEKAGFASLPGFGEGEVYPLFVILALHLMAARSDALTEEIRQVWRLVRRGAVELDPVLFGKLKAVTNLNDLPLYQGALAFRPFQRFSLEGYREYLSRRVAEIAA